VFTQVDAADRARPFAFSVKVLPDNSYEGALCACVRVREGGVCGGRGGGGGACVCREGRERKGDVALVGVVDVDVRALLACVFVVGARAL
jgi:hypothetical protein